ncbi:MAG: peptidoglycan-binding domain-containing protein [Terracidiphilus sp.]
MFSIRAGVALRFVVTAALIASPLLASSTAKSTTTHRATTKHHSTATHHNTTTHRATSAHQTTGTHHTSAAHHATTAAHGGSTHRITRNRKGKGRVRGQQAIEPERVTEIQLALIREHYLNEEANGEWDAATIAAMQKYQADQGWQTKLTPDSRALKKLGLGPDYSNAINAKDSSFGEPPPAATIPEGQSAGFAAAAGINR